MQEAETSDCGMLQCTLFWAVLVIIHYSGLFWLLLAWLSQDMHGYPQDVVGYPRMGLEEHEYPAWIIHGCPVLYALDLLS